MRRHGLAHRAAGGVVLEEGGLEGGEDGGLAFLVVARDHDQAVAQPVQHHRAGELAELRDLDPPQPHAPGPQAAVLEIEQAQGQGRDVALAGFAGSQGRELARNRADHRRFAEAEEVALAGLGHQLVADLQVAELARPAVERRFQRRARLQVEHARERELDHGAFQAR